MVSEHNVSLLNLIHHGLLPPNTQVRYNYRGVQHLGYIHPKGEIHTTDGTVYTNPTHWTRTISGNNCSGWGTVRVFNTNIPLLKLKREYLMSVNGSIRSSTNSTKKHQQQQQQQQQYNNQSNSTDEDSDDDRGGYTENASSNQIGASREILSSSTSASPSSCLSDNPTPNAAQYGTTSTTSTTSTAAALAKKQKKKRQQQLAHQQQQQLAQQQQPQYQYQDQQQPQQYYGGGGSGSSSVHSSSPHFASYQQYYSQVYPHAPQSPLVHPSTPNSSFINQISTNPTLIPLPLSLSHNPFPTTHYSTYAPYPASLDGTPMTYPHTSPAIGPSSSSTQQTPSSPPHYSSVNPSPTQPPIPHLPFQNNNNASAAAAAGVINNPTGDYNSPPPSTPPSNQNSVDDDQNNNNNNNNNQQIQQQQHQHPQHQQHHQHHVQVQQQPSHQQIYHQQHSFFPKSRKPLPQHFHPSHYLAHHAHHPIESGIPSHFSPAEQHLSQLDFNSHFNSNIDTNSMTPMAPFTPTLQLPYFQSPLYSLPNLTPQHIESMIDESQLTKYDSNQSSLLPPPPPQQSQQSPMYNNKSYLYYPYTTPASQHQQSQVLLQHQHQLQQHQQQLQQELAKQNQVVHALEQNLIQHDEPSDSQSSKRKKSSSKKKDGGEAGEKKKVGRPASSPKKRQKHNNAPDEAVDKIQMIDSSTIQRHLDEENSLNSSDPDNNNNNTNNMNDDLNNNNNYNNTHYNSNNTYQQQQHQQQYYQHPQSFPKSSEELTSSSDQQQSYYGQNTNIIQSHPMPYNDSSSPIVTHHHHHQHHQQQSLPQIHHHHAGGVNGENMESQEGHVIVSGNTRVSLNDYVKNSAASKYPTQNHMDINIPYYNDHAVRNRIDLCKVCLSGDVPEKGGGSSLIVCVDCGEVYHTFCIGLPDEVAKSVDRDGWKCAECKCCSVCNGLHDEELLLVCDHCDQCYHTYCAGLKSIPEEDDWLCSACSDQDRVGHIKAEKTKSKEPWLFIPTKGKGVAGVGGQDQTVTCVLCHVKGNLGIQGRLLPLDHNLDKFVHLSCIYWSSGILVSEDSILIHSNNIIQYAKKMKCTHCYKNGATIGCLVETCDHIYHLECAMKSKAKMNPDNRTLRCHKHFIELERLGSKGASNKQMAQELVKGEDTDTCNGSIDQPNHFKDIKKCLNEFENRKIFLESYVDSTHGEKYINIESGKDLLLRFGTLLLLNLGSIVDDIPLFHSNDHIYPVGYRIIKRYWSVFDQYSRIDYLCEISQHEDSPYFLIVPIHYPSSMKEEDRSKYLFYGTSLANVWNQFITAVNQIRSNTRKSIVMPVSTFFGFNEKSIVSSLENIPESLLCKWYSRKYILDTQELQTKLEIEMNNITKNDGCARTRKIISNRRKKPTINNTNMNQLGTSKSGISTTSTTSTMMMIDQEERNKKIVMERERLRSKIIAFKVREKTITTLFKKLQSIYSIEKINQIGFPGFKDVLIGLISSSSSSSSSNHTNNSITTSINNIDHTHLLSDNSQYHIMKNEQSRVVIKPSSIHSLGAFAKKSLVAGEFIIEYVGEIIRQKIADEREARYQRDGVDCFMFAIEKDVIVDATFKGNRARFANHSCDPNAKTKIISIDGIKKIIIVALKDIATGEEITYDYQFQREKLKIKCLCQSSKCKGYLN